MRAANTPRVRATPPKSGGSYLRLNSAPQFPTGRKWEEKSTRFYLSADKLCLTFGRMAGGLLAYSGRWRGGEITHRQIAREQPVREPRTWRTRRYTGSTGATDRCVEHERQAGQPARTDLEKGSRKPEMCVKIKPLAKSFGIVRKLNNQHIEKQAVIKVNSS